MNILQTMDIVKGQGPYHQVSENVVGDLIVHSQLLFHIISSHELASQEWNSNQKTSGSFGGNVEISYTF